MTQIHNIVKKQQKSHIKYTLEDLERNENDTIKVYEPLKISNDWYSPKNHNYENKRRTYLK